MEKYIEVPIHLSEKVVKDIDSIVQYKNMKDLVFTNKNPHKCMESFIIGCVCHYIRNIKAESEGGINITSLMGKAPLKNRIKEHMKALGITQSELAKKTGISTSNISLIVSNKNQPALDYFIRIWVALDCPPIDKLVYRVE